MNARAALSRRDLLKAGSLAVAFTLGAPFRPAWALGPMPGQVSGKVPDMKKVDSWLVIQADNTVTLLAGRSEVGQGGVLGLLQIAAEELDVSLAQITARHPESGRDPETGETVGSSSIHVVGPLVRQAAAEARQALLALAAQRLGAPSGELTVADGVVSAGSGAARRVSYGELVGGRQLQLQVTGKAPVKPTSAYRIVGQSAPRLDVREKVTGTFTFAQHVRVPDMLHGRVVRPRGQGPYGRSPQVVSIDASSVAHLPDVRVVRKRNFVGVVATREWDAVQAAAALEVVWNTPAGLHGHDGVFAAMRASKTEDSVVQQTGDTAQAFRTAAHVVTRAYDGPYQAHAPFAPHCAVADVRADSATIHCSTQGVYVTRMEVAKITGLPLEQVTVHHVEGSGTFGPSCYHDVAQAAAVMSQLVGQPVRVQFMRWDEFGWDNYGPGHTATVRLSADQSGRMTGYAYDGWQQGWIGIEMTEELALGTEPADPPSGISRRVNKVNAGSMYDVPNRLLTNHHVWAKAGFLRGNPLRSPVDLAISFASEQAVDELARLAGVDPLEFRRRNTRDERWRGVLDAVDKASGWTTARTAPPQPGGKLRRARGVGLGTHFVSYGAAVADVEVNLQTGEVRVVELFGALDCGLVVNPRLVERQVTGMLIQATSRILYEEVQFNDRHVTSLDWGTYPVLRFDQVPKVHAILVDRPQAASTGAGEEVMAAAAGAIANAVSAALGGVHLRRFPLVAERVKSASV